MIYTYICYFDASFSKTKKISNAKGAFIIFREKSLFKLSVRTLSSASADYAEADMLGILLDYITRYINREDTIYIFGDAKGVIDCINSKRPKSRRYKTLRNKFTKLKQSHNVQLAYIPRARNKADAFLRKGKTKRTVRSAILNTAFLPQSSQSAPPLPPQAVTTRNYL